MKRTVHLMRPNTIVAALTLASGICSSEPSVGQQPGQVADQQVQQQEQSVPGEVEKEAKEKESVEPSTRFNVALKTAGGTQFWTDYGYRGGYRVQQNALTHHWRLLDPNDVRRAWGTRSQCETALDQIQPRNADAVPPANAVRPKQIVLLLHGLMRTHHSMKPLEGKLQDKGYTVVRFSYASTRSSISNHAHALRQVVRDMPADAELHFIGHSMGNIVIRHMIGDLQRDGDPNGVLARSRSMVMLGPPNQGAAIARRLAATGLYGLLTGKGGLELGPQWDEFVRKLGTPPFAFAIIAGDVSDAIVHNPLVDGSSDFVVSVDEARLAGAKWIKTVPVLHSFLMCDEAAQEMTITFIESHGSPTDSKVNQLIGPGR